MEEGRGRTVFFFSEAFEFWLPVPECPLCCNNLERTGVQAEAISPTAERFQHRALPGAEFEIRHRRER